MVLRKVSHPYGSVNVKPSIQALLERNSAPKLCEPAPSASEIELMLKGALRAPDHARLKPWRFLVIQNEGREALGEAMCEVAALNADLTEAEAEKIKAKPLRAPLIICPVVHYTEHPKVPLIEQQLSVGCAVQNILHIADQLNYGAVWRTGSITFKPQMGQRLGLANNEHLLGFIYIGTRNSKAKPLPDLEPQDFILPWPIDN